MDDGPEALHAPVLPRGEGPQRPPDEPAHDGGAAPADLAPKKVSVAIRLPGKGDWTGGSLSVEAIRSTLEITTRNNVVRF